MAIKNKIIGISISDSENLGELGFGDFHLLDANLEIARHLLANGYTLAYGGDLRQMGFSTNLFELVKHYSPMEEKQRVFLHSFLGYPILNELSPEIQTNVLNVVEFHKLALPNDLSPKTPKELFDCKTPEDQYYWFRSMTHMREKMNDFIDARIVLGGQTTPFVWGDKGYKSKFSGIVEEVFLAMQSSKPIFICGAFGGAAKVVVDIIETGRSNCLNLEFFKDKSQYLEAINLYNSKHPDQKVDFESLSRYMLSKGIKGLNNGLTDIENKLLFTTVHIPQMISLILKGLKKCF